MRALAALLLTVSTLTAPSAFAENGAVAAVKRIYSGYLASKPTAANAPDMLAPAHFSKRINQMIAQMRKRCVKDEICGPDYDVFVNGQDYQLHDLRVDLVSESGDKAVVEARFKNFELANDIVFSMKREGSNWVIDEMESKGASKGPSLSAALTTAAP